MAECPKCGMPMDDFSSMCIDCYPDDDEIVDNNEIKKCFIPSVEWLSKNQFVKISDGLFEKSITQDDPYECIVISLCNGSYWTIEFFRHGVDRTSDRLFYPKTEQELNMFENIFIK